MGTLKVDTVVGSDGTSPVTLTKQSAAKVWINYDQSAPTVNDSFAQSSTTDSGTGLFLLNFTNNMTNKHYSVSGAGSYAGVVMGHRTTDNNASANPSTTSYFNGHTMYYAPAVTLYDSRPVTINIHGDLA